MTVLGCDISNWTGFLTADHVACLKQHDIKHVVIRASLEKGKQRSEIARQQMDALTAGGIDWSVYLWAYASWSPEQTVIDTVALLGGRPCRYLWLDAEDTADPPGPGWLVRAVAEIERQGREPGIYTGAWWWNDPRYAGGSTALAHVPLWNALYDGIPDLTVWQPYGGWTHQTGKQYAGSGQQSLCGLFVDLNVFDAAVLTPAPKPEPEPCPDLQPLLDALTVEAQQHRLDAAAHTIRAENIETLVQSYE